MQRQPRNPTAEGRRILILGGGTHIYLFDQNLNSRHLAVGSAAFADAIGTMVREQPHLARQLRADLRAAATNAPGPAAHVRDALEAVLADVSNAA